MRWFFYWADITLDVDESECGFVRYGYTFAAPNISAARNIARAVSRHLGGWAEPDVCRISAASHNDFANYYSLPAPILNEDMEKIYG